MSNSTITTIESSLMNDINSLDGEHVLVAYNNDITPFDLVVAILVASIPCPISYGISCASQIHHLGSCEIVEGSYNRCFEVQSALAEIKVESKILPKTILNE